MQNIFMSAPVARVFASGAKQPVVGIEWVKMQTEIWHTSFRTTGCFAPLAMTRLCYTASEREVKVKSRTFSGGSR
jgi:hypothetical protein